MTPTSTSPGPERPDATGPVVVAVLSHRDPPLLRRLVARLLDGEHTLVLVHHDPRGPAPGLPPDDRILFVPDPEPCDWGRIGLARAMLRCVEVAAERVPDLSWVIMVSGQDYPCRHMTSIERELATSPHDAYLRWLRSDGDPRDDVHPWQARTRQRYLQRLRLPFTRRHVAFPRRSPFGHDLGLYVGDTWPNLGAAAVAHLLAQGPLRRRVEPYLKWCASPDEALLPTLLLNGAEHLDIVNERKRYMRWVPGEAHPRLLEPDDVPAIATSGDFFARKVDSERTAAVLDLLDAATASGSAPPISR